MKTDSNLETAFLTFYTTFPYLKAWKDYKVCADVADHWLEQDNDSTALNYLWYVHKNPVDLQLFWFTLQYLVRNQYSINSLQLKLYDWVCEYYPLYCNMKKYNTPDEFFTTTHCGTDFRYVDTYKGYAPTFPIDSMFYAVREVIDTFGSAHLLSVFSKYFIKNETLDYNDYVLECLEASKPVNVSTYMDWRKDKLPAPVSKKVIKHNREVFPFN